MRERLRARVGARRECSRRKRRRGIEDNRRRRSVRNDLAACSDDLGMEELRGGQRAVTRGHVGEALREALGETIDDVHGAMLAARAPDRHGEIAAIARAGTRECARR